MKSHHKYFQLNINSLPHHYTTSLYLLDLLEKDEFKSKSKGWIDWIYSLQVIESSSLGGFRGGPFLGGDFHPAGTFALNEYDIPHLAMTYAALASLLILGDDLGKVQKSKIIRYIAACQQPNGSFSPFIGSEECDMRFIFCACAISEILNDWTGINVLQALKYIQQSQSYDGGFGVGPNKESHGGSSYCAIASLKLMNRLDAVDCNSLLFWLTSRQGEGFHGRINKEDDTCYGYWIGSALDILGHGDLVDLDALQTFLDQTKSNVGGYGKSKNSHPDIMHSYMGIASLRILNGQRNEFCTHLGIPQRCLNK